jgi:DNA-binding GntR family transcriptional regulator
MMEQLQKPRPLYEQVYERIRKAIFTGEINYGERINEVQIAQNLNVSRGPVRESIRGLEQEGLLVRDSRNQLYIYRPNLEDLKYIYQCRKVLESLAAELAASRISNAEKKLLKHNVERTRAALELEATSDSDPYVLVNENSQFHEIIVKASGNPRLEQQLKQLKSLTYFYRQHVQSDSRKQISLGEHYKIYEAIVNGKIEVAKREMEKHIENDLEHLTAIFPLYCSK